MQQNFETAFQLIIEAEGGYVNDPSDPGGETKYGISKRQYPDEDIPNMTLERAKELYRRDYWTPCKCDEMPYPLDILLFDAAVNQGCDAAKKMLQKSLNVAQDGILGLDTMSKARYAKLDACARFLATRGVRYTGTRGADRYMLGWFSRMFKIALRISTEA